MKEQSLAGVLAGVDVRLLVIDDPDARAAAASAGAGAAARRDGRERARPRARADRVGPGDRRQPRDDSQAWPATDALLGPRYAVLDPSLLTAGPSRGGAVDARAE